MLAHGPGLLPAGLTGKRQGGERGHMGPWPQPRGQGPLLDFFLKEAARRHDSSLLKFRTPTEIQVPLLAAASMARISSYADIPGVGRRAADAVEVGSRPWFRFCPAPLLPVRDVGTWAGSIDAVTSGTPRAADGGTGTPVAPPPSAPVVLAFFFFGFFTGFGAPRAASVAIMPSSAPLGQGSASDGSSTAPAASLSEAIGFCFPGLLLRFFTVATAVSPITATAVVAAGGPAGTSMPEAPAALDFFLGGPLVFFAIDASN